MAVVGSFVVQVVVVAKRLRLWPNTQHPDGSASSKPDDLNSHRPLIGKIRVRGLAVVTVIGIYGERLGTVADGRLPANVT
jgi:hypothetical protein